MVLYNSNPPVKGVENWQAAFLPATCQATAVDTQHRDVSRLLENIHSPFAAPAEQRLQLDLLTTLTDATPPREPTTRGSRPDQVV